MRAQTASEFQEQLRALQAQQQEDASRLAAADGRVAEELRAVEAARAAHADGCLEAHIGRNTQTVGRHSDAFCPNIPPIQGLRVNRPAMYQSEHKNPSGQRVCTYTLVPISTRLE